MKPEGEFAEYKAAMSAGDHDAAAAVADPAGRVEETPEQQPSGENSVEKELRERVETARKPEVKRDWRDGKVPTGVQKRFDKLTAERHEQQQRAERAEARLRELEVGRQPQRTEENGNGEKADAASQKPGEKAGQKPGWDDPAVKQRIEQGRQRYRDWDETFERARKDNIQIPDAAIAAAEKLENHVDVFYELAKDPSLCAKLLSSRPEESVAAVQAIGRGLPTVRAVREALAEQENGGQVYAHLQQHPEIGEKIGKMTPAQAYKAIVKLAVELDAGSKREPLESKAPKPITPVNTAGKGNYLPPVDDMSFSDYKKARADGRI